VLMLTSSHNKTDNPVFLIFPLKVTIRVKFIKIVFSASTTE